MYNVGNNLLTSPLAGLGGGAMPGIGAPGSGGFGSASAVADAIDPTLQPSTFGGASSASWLGAGNGPGGFIAQFMSTFFGALSQMAQYFTSMAGTPPWSSSSPYAPANGATPSSGNAPANGGQPAQGSGNGRMEQFFSSADLSSKGDPHDRFEGTLADGETVGGRWNNMADHPHLLESTSFIGGFDVSTQTSERDQKGITHNESASIETNYGRNVVTMNADGSYSVEKDGTAVDLQVGKSVDLGRGESVTLNADNSLTVVDKNASGGSITTTLSSNGTAVNVSADATNVDLGGYLARHAGKMPQPASGSDEPGTQASAQNGAQVPLAGNMLAPPPSTQFETYQPYQPYGNAASDPIVAGTQQFGALT